MNKINWYLVRFMSNRYVQAFMSNTQAAEIVAVGIMRIVSVL